MLKGSYSGRCGESLTRVELLNAFKEHLQIKDIDEDMIMNKIKVLKEENKMETLKKIQKDIIRLLQQ